MDNIKSLVLKNILNYCELSDSEVVRKFKSSTHFADEIKLFTREILAKSSATWSAEKKEQVFGVLFCENQTEFFLTPGEVIQLQMFYEFLAIHFLYFFLYSITLFSPI